MKRAWKHFWEHGCVLAAGEPVAYEIEARAIRRDLQREFEL